MYAGLSVDGRLPALIDGQFELRINGPEDLLNDGLQFGKVGTRQVRTQVFPACLGRCDTPYAGHNDKDRVFSTRCLSKLRGGCFKRLAQQFRHDVGVATSELQPASGEPRATNYGRLEESCPLRMQSHAARRRRVLKGNQTL